MKKIIVFISVISLFIISCSDNSNTEKIIVASEQADCVGVAPQKCLLIKEEGKNEWTFMYQGIEGFNYEPGYEYTLRIKKEKIENPAQDQSSIKYILVKEISKIKKDSEGLPNINNN